MRPRTSGVRSSGGAASVVVEAGAGVEGAAGAAGIHARATRTAVSRTASTSAGSIARRTRERRGPGAEGTGLPHDVVGTASLQRAHVRRSRVDPLQVLVEV